VSCCVVVDEQQTLKVEEIFIVENFNRLVLAWDHEVMIKCLGPCMIDPSVRKDVHLEVSRFASLETSPDKAGRSFVYCCTMCVWESKGKVY